MVGRETAIRWSLKKNTKIPYLVKDIGEIYKDPTSTSTSVDASSNSKDCSQKPAGLLSESDEIRIEKSSERRLNNLFENESQILLRVTLSPMERKLIGSGFFFLDLDFI